MVDGYVLHQRPYRETSVLLEVFARHQGRVGLVARGARRPASTTRGQLRAFTPLLLSWSGRGELGNLHEVEGRGAVPELTGRALFCGFYLNELVLRLTERNDPHPELYVAYESALASLRASEPPEPVLRIFELRLLRALGYGLVLEHEADTDRPILAERRYRYLRETGPVADGIAEGDVVSVSGATLLALGREQLDDPVQAREAKRLLRWLLADLLGPRPLATRALFRGD
ncbi:MAG: DNA repair protein RecO [Ectothiorhodospiraceae bacterium]|nr:DNA repair protein RecO [Ectothiorhodospiraceae bacterium]